MPALSHRSYTSLSVVVIWALALCVFINFFTSADGQQDICMSPFKCEEELASLQEKMVRAHNRFGNYDSEARNCIISAVRKVYINLLPSDCLSSTMFEDAFVKSLGDCIEEIKEVRDRISRLLKVGRLGKISNAGRKGCNSTTLLVDNVSEKDGEPLSQVGTIPSLRALPYTSVLRRLARATRLEQPSNRAYPFSCSGGLHWCCIYVGESQYGCFGMWCPAVSVACHWLSMSSTLWPWSV